jgi:hypothetical protein
VAARVQDFDPDVVLRGLTDEASRHTYSFPCSNRPYFFLSRRACCCISPSPSASLPTAPSV